LLKETETAGFEGEAGNKKRKKSAKKKKKEVWFCVVDQKAVRFQSRQHLK
jgi:hypothetical protein